MRAGILNETIQILRLKHETNEYNEQLDMYVPCCMTRANITTVSGGRTDVNNEVFYAHTYRFVVRRYVQVGDFDRLMWKDNQYRILNIDDDRVLQQKTITAELVNE